MIGLPDSGKAKGSRTERIVDELQQALYLSYDDEADAFRWNPDKEWSGFDVCAALSGVLGEFSMIPEEAKPFE